MKVLQILPELESGGVERGTLELAEYLVRHGHESLVISGGGKLVAELERDGTRHITWPIGRKALSTLKLIPVLRKLLREEKPDILHLRSRVPAWIAWFAWRGLPKATRPRLVTTVHGFYSVNRWSEIMTCGERVIAVSDCIAEYIRQSYPRVDMKKVRVVYRGIAPEAYPHGYQPTTEWRESFANEFPLTRDKRLLILPGRITRLKGHEDFFKIIQQLQYPDVIGVVVGGVHEKKQEYGAELRELVRTMGLEEKIVFTGGRSDLREILAISDIVFSLTTQPESFGRTTLEALGLGRPVIGYEHGGVGEILDAVFPDGKVASNDWEAAARKARSFLDQAPNVPASHPFSLQAMLEGTCDVYRELLAEARSGR